MLFYDRMMRDPRTQQDMERHRRASLQYPDNAKIIAPGTHVLTDAVVIEATNVAAYYHEQYGWSLPDEIEDFVPSIAPPFPVAWFETRLTDEHMKRGGHDAHGALCQSIDLWEYTDNSDPDDRQREANKVAQTLADQTTQGIDGQALHIPEWPTLRDDVRWVSYWWSYILFRGSRIVGPLIELRVFITPEGNIAGIGSGNTLAAIARSVAIFHDNADNDMDGAMKGAALMLNPFWLAIGFCHCKNVVPVEGELPPKKLRIQQEKKLGAALAKFYTLQIDPMKQVLRDEGQIEKTGLKRALHICRGHFATYSEDKPLFGRLSGTFWRPAHVRGDPESGAIGKIYSINPPKNGGEA